MSAAALQDIAGRYWEVLNRPEWSKFPLVFSHHTMWQGIDAYINDDRQRLLEIYSQHGSSETREPAATPHRLRMSDFKTQGDPPGKYGAREVLNGGHHLGFTGGSDNHQGQPGADAITAVLTPSLARSDLMEALYERRCYATSGNRTLIEFFAGHTAMGGTMKSEANSMLYCFVAGDGIIDRVEIIGNGHPIYSCEPAGKKVISFGWPVPSHSAGYYYVRVLLNNGTEAAWSSPIWITE
jgi:hypothetical protein